MDSVHPLLTISSMDQVRAPTTTSQVSRVDGGWWLVATLALVITLALVFLHSITMKEPEHREAPVAGYEGRVV